MYLYEIGIDKIHEIDVMLGFVTLSGIETLYPELTLPKHIRAHACTYIHTHAHTYTSHIILLYVYFSCGGLVT